MTAGAAGRDAEAGAPYAGSRDRRRGDPEARARRAARRRQREIADKHIAWGPGPRASQALTLCARARALYQGRLAPSVDDVSALAEPVLQHRMALNFAARAEGMTVRGLVA